MSLSHQRHNYNYVLNKKNNHFKIWSYFLFFSTHYFLNTMYSFYYRNIAGYFYSIKFISGAAGFIICAWFGLFNSCNASWEGASARYVLWSVQILFGEDSYSDVPKSRDNFTILACSETHRKKEYCYFFIAYMILSDIHWKYNSLESLVNDIFNG